MDFIGRCGTSTVLMRFSCCKQNVSAASEKGGLVFQGISLEIEHKRVSNSYNWRMAHGAPPHSGLM